MAGDPTGKKLWGGRFEGGQSTITEEISASIHFDHRLYRQDIRGSRAHARMLQSIGVLTADELAAILGGLDAIEAEIASGTFPFSAAREDIHMNIEAVLTERIGDAGRKLHTGRSRNDQVALDVRLYVRDEAAMIGTHLSALIGALTAAAEANVDTVMPGYTHLQVAQPVRLGHHLLAWAWGLLRDAGRLRAAVAAANRLPLGSGALAGLNYPTDREMLRQELGFDAVIMNSMDAVSDRDFVLDFLYFAAVCGVRLSRMAEELVLWSSAEFAFVRLADGVTTGSSIMPQKRNPDVAELVRGKSGRLFGNLVSLLTVLKGLPMAYNRDFQEDKEPLFDSVDTIRLCLAGMTEMIATMTMNRARMAEAVHRNFSTATDLADHLVRRGVPFRRAHEIVGAVVRHCEKECCDFFSLTVEDLRGFAPEFGDDITAALDPANSTDAKASPGSTARSEVMRQLDLVRRELAALGLDPAH